MDLVHLASLYPSASLSAERSNSTYQVVIMRIKEINMHHILSSACHILSAVGSYSLASNDSWPENDVFPVTLLSFSPLSFTSYSYFFCSSQSILMPHNLLKV